MKLRKLAMENFRQFFGRAELDLANEKDRPITVIHGTNGAGKTTLLNAFTWCLYKEFTPAFSEPGELLNRRALSEAEVGADLAARVELVFDHQGKRYEVCRQRSNQKKDENTAVIVGSDEVTVVVTDEQGETRKANNPEKVINSILPRHLFSYFFFDGERIENIVRQDKKQRQEIAQATKSLMGVEVFDRAILHIRGDRGRRGVRRELEDELEKLGDANTRELLNQQHSLEEDRQKNDEDILQREEEITSCNAEIAAIDTRLRDLKPAADLQQKRDQLQEQYKVNTDLLQKVEKELRRILGSKAHFPFLAPAASSCQEVLDTLKTSGELPSGLKRHFVDSLLDASQCICDRPLANKSAERSAVEKWRDRAGLVDVEQRALRLSGSIEELPSRAEEFHADLDDSMKRRLDLQGEQNRIEEELREISAGLSNVPEEDIGMLESRRSELEHRRSELSRELGGIQQKNRDLGILIGRLEKEIERQRATEKKQRTAQKRLQTCGEVLEVLARVQEDLVQNVREDLQARISKLFGKITYKPYRPQLSEDYTLRMVQTVGGQELPVAASAGENQILSLSFIGSIVATAAERHSKADGLPWQGPLIYPIVMDSPFGTLDSEYRKQIAHHIPELAPQIVVMVSQTQWRGEVEKEMTPRIGKQYVLVYHGEPNGTADCEVSIGGHVYPLLCSANGGLEFTDILEVQ